MVKPVIVIYGGTSQEREVSIASARYVLEILRALYPYVGSIEIASDGLWVFSGKVALLGGEDIQKYDISCAIRNYAKSLSDTPSKKDVLAKEICVFPLIHGTYGEDGCLQGLCELFQLSYVGSGVLGSAICMDKSTAKRICMQMSIPTLPFALAKKHHWLENPLKETSRLVSRLSSYPQVVKPCSQGSSYGVSKVASEEELQKALELAFSLGDKVICEPYLDDVMELECGMLWDGKKMCISEVGEVKHAGGIYTYKSKYHKGRSELSLLAKEYAHVAKKVQRYTRELCEVLDLTGMARIDWFYVPGLDKLYFNEINTIPGMAGETSHYLKLWSFSGKDSQEVISSLVKGALGV